MTERKINVLVAEDSTVTRLFLVHLLESDPQICVIGAVGAANGDADVETHAIGTYVRLFRIVHRGHQPARHATHDLRWCMRPA